MPALTPGKRLPAFTLPDTEGRAVDVPALLSKGPLWLIVGKSNCPTCRLAAPWAERAHRDLRGQGGSVVLISEDTATYARAFARKLGLTLPILVEEEPYPVSARLGLTNVPTFFLVEEDGIIARTSIGFVRSEWEKTAAEMARRANLGDYHLILSSESDAVPTLRPG